MYIKVLKLKTIAFIFAVLTISLTTGIILYNTFDNYINVFAPHNNDLTLVIDAGHGGMDGGAIAADGTTEQYINLCIAKNSDLIANFFGINTIMSRDTEDSLDYNPSASIHNNKVADTRKRESLVGSLKNPIFLSIHLNKFEESKYKGAQVFYSANNPDGVLLAKALQKSLINGLDKNNNRRAKKADKTIYLMKKLKCPAVIVECGFLSNPTELKNLTDINYQKRAALCIVSGYLNYLESTDKR